MKSLLIAIIVAAAFAVFSGTVRSEDKACSVDAHVALPYLSPLHA